MNTSAAELLRTATLLPRFACPDNRAGVGVLFFITNIVVGLSYAGIAYVLLLDRAAATRAMFDNRLAFGAFIVLCAWSRFVMAMTSYVEVHWLEKATMAATCAVALFVAWTTFRALKVTRTAPK